MSIANLREIVLTKLLKLFFFTFLHFPNLTVLTSMLKVLDTVVMVVNSSESIETQMIILS